MPEAPAAGLSGGSRYEDLLEMLKPFDAKRMRAYEVSPLVNRSSVDTPEVINLLQRLIIGHRYREASTMIRRVYSAWSRCALVVAAAGSLALVSLTARSQSVSPRQPSAASQSEEARKAQQPWVSAEYIDWLSINRCSIRASG